MNNLETLDHIKSTAIDAGMQFGPKVFVAIIILIVALSKLGDRNRGRMTSTPSAASSRTIVRVLITGDPPSGRPAG